MTRLRILSLGAGVESTTLAMLSKHGELPALDHAIFADTGWERQVTYDHLRWLIPQLPFPVHWLTPARKIQEQPERTPGTRFISLPMFTNGGEGRLWRQCTKEWKIEAIHRKVRELVGLAPGERGGREIREERWIGYNREQVGRIADPMSPWVQHRYPLIEDRPMNRLECIAWMFAHGYPEPPRSSCIGCPNHTDAEWRRLKIDSPEEFAQAVEFERVHGSSRGAQREQAFLHRSCVPLNQVDLSTAEDRGQLNWLDHCGGDCGT
ncbi:MAG TPA: hypothetical protein VI729_09335 [Anaerolineales bacterium]|nr:hypothetical protein [Anaerolineales bacterium]